MPPTRKVKLAEIERFIRGSLKDKPKTDLKNLRIVKEADLECCAYFHLRRFLRVDSLGSYLCNLQLGR